MLFCQNFRGTHISDLKIAVISSFRTGIDDSVRGGRGYCRLTASDIPLEKTRHGEFAPEILQYMAYRFFLGTSKWEGESSNKITELLFCFINPERIVLTPCQAIEIFPELNEKDFFKRKSFSGRERVCLLFWRVNPD